MKLIKTLGINIAVLFALLVVLNLTILVIVQLRRAYYSTSSQPVDTRASLPNYANIQWASTHFNEFNSLKSEYRSYVGWRRLPYQGKTITINNDGIRHTEHKHKPGDNAQSIAFLGGSTIWGTGVNNANTIPSIFAGISSGKFRCYNFGEAGYNAFQSYLFLQLQFINGFNADVVISYDGVNNNNISRPFSHSREKQIIERMKGADTDDEAFSLRRFLIGPIEATILKLKPSKTINTDSLYNSKAMQNAMATELVKSWMATKRITEANGGIFVAVLQPNALVGKPELGKLHISESRHQYDFYPEVLRLIQSPQYSVLQDNFLDLTNALDHKSNVYIDFCHLSPNGNAIIASRLYEHILKLQSRK